MGDFVRKMCDILNLPCQELLVKTDETEDQHFLDENLRKGNLLGIFSTVDEIDILDKRILLCDDIKTTGATLSQCAKELKLSGAEKVIVITALTVYPKNKDKEKQTVEKK